MSALKSRRPSAEQDLPVPDRVRRFIGGAIHIADFRHGDRKAG